MILAAIVGLILAVGVLAVVSGFDSRDTAPSEEHVMAVRGMMWRTDHDYDVELARELAEALARHGSHRLESSQSRHAEGSQDGHSSIRAA